MNARAARIFALLLLVSCSLVASNENDYGAELRRQVTQDGGPHWLFVPHGHVDLSAEEVRLIGEWLTAHDTGWKPASVLDVSPSKPTQHFGVSFGSKHSRIFKVLGGLSLSR